MAGSDSAAGSSTVTDGAAAYPLTFLSYPHQIYLDTVANFLYIAEYTNDIVVKVDVDTGLIYKVAGKGTSALGSSNVQATAAIINAPTGICMDPSGNKYFSEHANHRYRKISATGILTTFAGTGGIGSTGSGGAATSARVYFPQSCTCDTAGSFIYIVERNNHVVRRVNLATNIITDFVGLAGIILY